MKAIINGERFMPTFRNILSIRGKGMASNVLMALGIIALLIFIESSSYARTNLSHDPLRQTIITYFWMGYILISVICAGQMFKPLGKKTTATSLLMLPASNLEKFLSLMLICVILPPIAFFVGFEILDFLRVAIVHIVNPDLTGVTMVPILKIFVEVHYGMSIVFALILLLQSFFTLGSSVWPRRGVTRSFLALIVLITFYSIWLTTLWRMVGGKLIMHDMQMTQGMCIVVSCVTLACALLNYVVAYFRFKEAEIINRF